MSSQSDSTYLVLGANGFVGSYLVEELAKLRNVHIKAFDRYTQSPKIAQKQNISFIKGDVFNEKDIANALVGVTHVIHSFSATTPFVSDQNPYKDIEENLSNTVRIFDMCSKASITKIGFISSAGTVYGRVTELKTATEDDVPMPVSPYGINKLSLEHYLEYFKRRSGVDYMVYRLTNPFGPRQIFKNEQGVIPSFIGKITNNEELTVYGDGSISRDYIYMPDAAKMIVSSFTGSSTHQIYNIGSGQQTSLGEIIESLRTITDKDIRVRYADAPKTFLTHSSVSIDRFVTEFGVQPLTSLQDGLRQTYNSAAQ